MAYADQEVADQEVDVGFYNLIHHLVGISPQGKNAERRRQRREPFPTVQRIAPRREQRTPDESDFIEVVCHDLTRGGFSFFLPDKPDFDLLVAAFSGAAGVIYAGAEVVRYEGVLTNASGLVRRVASRPIDRDAKPMVLVRCRFTERLCDATV